MKRTALRRFTPLKQRTPLLRINVLRARSAKKAREDALRRREVKALGPVYCEWPGCPEWANDWHERRPRARGGSPTDPANRVLLCRFHHDLAHDERPEAYAAGVIVHSWTNERSVGD